MLKMLGKVISVYNIRINILCFYYIFCTCMTVFVSVIHMKDDKCMEKNNLVSSVSVNFLHLSVPLMHYDDARAGWRWGGKLDNTINDRSLQSWACLNYTSRWRLVVLCNYDLWIVINNESTCLYMWNVYAMMWSQK